jgi:adenosine deaminase
VFACSLSNEYIRAAKILQLSNEQLFQLSENAIQFAFASVEEKEDLKKIWNEWKEHNIISKQTI